MLEYRHSPALANVLDEPQSQSEPAITVHAAPTTTVTEDELKEQVARARAEAKSEAEHALLAVLEAEREQMRRSFEQSVRQFCADRRAYFKNVENGLVQLALSIVRKILQREAQLDPSLLGALVRIALDRMRCDGAVRLRVAACDAPLWRGMQVDGTHKIEWTIEPDETLSSGDCVVETELGAANFGFEAQVQSVEASLLELMAQRPERA